MLKIYEFGGLLYQFEEGTQPAGAVEAKKPTAPAKSRKPANKSRKPADK
jgi:hypothetical protein